MIIMLCFWIVTSGSHFTYIEPHFSTLSLLRSIYCSIMYCKNYQRGHCISQYWVKYSFGLTSKYCCKRATLVIFTIHYRAIDASEQRESRKMRLYIREMATWGYNSKTQHDNHCRHALKVGSFKQLRHLAYKMNFRVRLLSRKRIFMHASIWIAFFVIWSLLSTSRASILSLISLSKHIHTRYQAVLSK